MSGNCRISTGVEITKNQNGELKDGNNNSLSANVFLLSSSGSYRVGN